jgi:hypothetical protein
VSYPAGLTVCPRDGGLDKTLNIDFQTSPTPFSGSWMSMFADARVEVRIARFAFPGPAERVHPEPIGSNCFLTSFDISELAATDSKRVSDNVYV